MHLRIKHFQIARVDAVEAEQRHACGKRFRALPQRVDKHFLQIERAAERKAGFLPPVVKIAGDNQRAHRVHMPAHIFKNGLILLVAVGFAQIQMRTQTHQRKRPAFGMDFAMQHAALLEFVHADIEVVARFNRQMAQNGIAVVALGKHCVFAVAAVKRKMLADDVVMRLGGKRGQLELAAQVFALHLLQKKHVGFQALQGLGHAFNLHFAVERRHAFVHIISGNDNRRMFRHGVFFIIRG